MDWQSRYLQFPIFVQNCMVSLEGLRIQQKRYADDSLRFLNEYGSRLTMLRGFDPDFDVKTPATKGIMSV